MIAGLDGSAQRWVCLAEEGGEIQAHLLPLDLRGADLLLGCQVIAIDCPIGLMDSGFREADQLARYRLGARRSSVFPAPLRPMLDSVDYAEASRHALRLTGKGISQQAFNIFKTVSAVDLWRRSDRSVAGRAFEVHPEVSFLEICRYGLESKHTASGLVQRMLLVERHFPGQLERAADQLRGQPVKADDLLDAFAALWTARRILAGEAVSLPSAPPVDAFGIPMAIWF